MSFCEEFWEDDGLEKVIARVETSITNLGQLEGTFSGFGAAQSKYASAFGKALDSFAQVNEVGTTKGMFQSLKQEMQGVSSKFERLGEFTQGLVGSVSGQVVDARAQVKAVVKKAEKLRKARLKVDVDVDKKRDMYHSDQASAAKALANFAECDSDKAKKKLKSKLSKAMEAAWSSHQTYAKTIVQSSEKFLEHDKETLALFEELTELNNTVNDFLKQVMTEFSETCKLTFEMAANHVQKVHGAVADLQPHADTEIWVRTNATGPERPALAFEPQDGVDGIGALSDRYDELVGKPIKRKTKFSLPGDGTTSNNTSATVKRRRGSMMVTDPPASLAARGSSDSAGAGTSGSAPAPVDAGPGPVVTLDDMDTPVQTVSSEASKNKARVARRGGRGGRRPPSRRGRRRGATGKGPQKPKPAATAAPAGTPTGTPTGTSDDAAAPTGSPPRAGARGRGGARARARGRGRGGASGRGRPVSMMGAPPGGAGLMGELNAALSGGRKPRSETVGPGVHADEDRVRPGRAGTAPTLRPAGRGGRARGRARARARGRGRARARARPVSMMVGASTRGAPVRGVARGRARGGRARGRVRPVSVAGMPAARAGDPVLPAKPKPAPATPAAAAPATTPAAAAPVLPAKPAPATPAAAAPAAAEPVLPAKPAPATPAAAAPATTPAAAAEPVPTDDAADLPPPSDLLGMPPPDMDLPPPDLDLPPPDLGDLPPPDLGDLPPPDLGDLPAPPAAADPTPAAADPTPAPADPTPAPADATPAAADPTPAPADPTPAAADPTPAAADPTPAPAPANAGGAKPPPKPTRARPPKPARRQG